MRVSKTREGPITAVLRIRGQGREAAVLSCQDWEQAVQKARRVLPHFEQRNPWLYFDSRKQKFYVLLDPETEPTMKYKSAHAQPQTKAVKKKGTHL